MVATHRKLDVLFQSLSDSGEDARRLEIVRRAINFKRAWVELADGLTTLQRTRAYEKWGYSDLHEYCSNELHIRPATTDKLLLSLNTVRDHAPQMLEQGTPCDVPSLDAVDYFSRALDLTGPGSKDAARRLDAPNDVDGRRHESLRYPITQCREPVARPHRLGRQRVRRGVGAVLEQCAQRTVGVRAERQP